MFERVAFADFEPKYHIFLNVKTVELDLNILLFKDTINSLQLFIFTNVIRSSRLPL